MNFLVRNMPERAHRALPIIAAAYNLRSSNEVILAAIDAMIATLCERDPIVAAGISLSCDDKRRLPARVKAPA